MNWVLKKFDEFTLQELYAVLQLRNEVFVVEQNCVYQDTDGKDQQAYHLMGWQKSLLAAYTRIFPPGSVYSHTSIGRVVTSPAVRRSGIGKKLMQHSIAECEKFFGKTAIQLSAQLYLKKFYESLGFVQTSAVYIEDGIEHIEMTRPSS